MEKMAKSLSITVHPSAIGAEYLSVADAMHQILDIVEALERTESVDGKSRQIVWRLTNAHTNSPPFTVTAEAFPVDPSVSVAYEATRVISSFTEGFRNLLLGEVARLDSAVLVPLKRAFQRNLNGVGRTVIVSDNNEQFNVIPSNARPAMVAIERLELEAQSRIVDHSRTEIGSAEIEVQALAKWYNKQAIIGIERLSRDKVTCVLSPELATKLGEAHKWEEVWGGRRLLVSGEIHYDKEGTIKRIDAEMADDMPWTDVSISDLRDIDILQGRSVSEHLRLLRGGDIG